MVSQTLNFCLVKVEGRLHKYDPGADSLHLRLNSSYCRPQTILPWRSCMMLIPRGILESKETSQQQAPQQPVSTAMQHTGLEAGSLLWCTPVGVHAISAEKQLPDQHLEYSHVSLHKNCTQCKDVSKPERTQSLKFDTAPILCDWLIELNRAS